MYEFRLSSSYTSQGSSEKPNEDGFFISPTHFLMIDGATGRAKDGRRFINDSKFDTDASWLVAQMIAHYPNFMSGEDDLRQHIRKFGYFLREHFLKQTILPDDAEKAELPCAAATFAHLDPERRVIQVAGLADTEAIIVFHDGSFEHLPPDPRSAVSEQFTIQELQAHVKKYGGTLNEARLATLHTMRGRAAVTNTAGHRGVINVLDTHTAPDDSFSNYKTYNAKDVERIIMYSDGIDDRYGLFTHQTLVEHSLGKTFENLVSQIRERENADPLGFTYPRVKKSDDATIVCATLHPI